MKQIKLSQGKVAIVDDDDYERVNAYKWFAHKNRNTYYAETKIERKNIALHRLILGVTDQHIDHINRNGLDNRKCNLRYATISQNNINSAKKKGCTSIYKGVYFHKDRGVWVSRARLHKGYYYLGSFQNEIEAAKAYDRKAIELFGEFACLNFPESKEVTQCQ